MNDALRLRLQAALGGAYVLDRELVGGGMSRVFVGRETALGRRIVLKVLPPEMATEEPVTRFRREAVLAARLQHPHIVPVYSVGEVDDLQYYTMPFIDGESLRARLERQHALPAVDARRVLREIGGALACAHRHGVVHRDVKPENIFIERATQRALLADFGVALALDEPEGVTQVGTTVGTPAYMSPEQVDGRRVDGLTDVYSLGLVGWEMLTGQRPWSGDSLYDVMYKQKHEALPSLDAFNIDVAPSLVRAIDRALLKDSQARWSSAEAFVAALGSEQDEMSAVAGQPDRASDADGADGGPGATSVVDAPTVVARARRPDRRSNEWASSSGWRPSTYGARRDDRWGEAPRARVVPAAILVLLVAAAAAGATTVGRRMLLAPFSTASVIAVPSPAGVVESSGPTIDRVPATDVAAGLTTIAPETRAITGTAGAPPALSTPARFAAVPIVHAARRMRHEYSDARSGASVRARVATAELQLHSYERVMANAQAAQAAHPTQASTGVERPAPAAPSAAPGAPPLAPAIPTSGAPGPDVPAAGPPDARPAPAAPPTADASPTRADAVRVAHGSPVAVAQTPAASCQPSFPGSHVCRVFDQRTGQVVGYQYVPNGVPARAP
jgi:predicted Ser/Thr protein kinase